MSMIAEQLTGRWLIREMEMWDSDDLDLVEPAHIEVRSDGTGKLAFVAVQAWCDFRAEEVEGRDLEFSWEGSDDGHPVSGRGWAVLRPTELRGRIYIHNGDASAFSAQREHGERR